MVRVNVGGNIVSNEKTVKLLSITVGNKLSFETLLNKICKKVRQKLHALARISTLISQNKLIMIMRAFITSQFSYCPLLWICHSRTINNNINKLHERALRLVYNDRQST